MVKITQVMKRNGNLVPFNKDRISNAIYRAAVEVGGRDKATADQLADQVTLLLEEKSKPGYIPTIEEIQDLVEKVLIENGHARVAKAYILYRDERARHRMQEQIQSSRPSENIPWAKLWHVLDWAVDHHVNTVSGLNQRIKAGEFSQLVTESEASYRMDLDKAAEGVIARRQEIRAVIISGPSSSGKTTTTIKLADRLTRAGMKLVALNVDNYFFDLEMHPKDEFGDYDFETPQALDLELINTHLRKMLNGEEALIPFYDFKTGHRVPNHTSFRLKENEILLIDSLHGLYPPMTEGIEDRKKFKVFLEPLMQLKDDAGEYVHWTDIRLIRRMLRDASHRAYDPRQTLEHWHYVRSSELRNIIPQINHTDVIINSAMPFELPIYAARMLADFQQWTRDYEGNILKEDAYFRANRVAKLLEAIVPVTEEELIPTDSVIREFIGGSSLKY
jgi:uridine kinase